jgi:hypothetical protein
MVSTNEIYATAIAVRSYNTTSVTLGWNEWAAVFQGVKTTYIAIGR